MLPAGPFRGFVLLYGRDESLLRTRQSLLEADGYIVTSIATTEEFETILPQVRSFGTVVFCHTLPEAEQLICESQIRTITPDISIYPMAPGTMPEEFLEAVAARR